MRNASGLVAACLLLASASYAAPVAGPWTNAVGQGDGPITDADTDHPIIGDAVDDPDTNSNAADGEMFDSPFPAVTLNDAGDKVTFTATVLLSGTVNSAASSGTPRTQFRFGIFDSDDDDLGWIGYYMSNKHGVSGTPAGVLAEKPAGNTSVYLSATGQSNLASVQGDGTAASLFNDDTYSMSITVERNVAGELLVMGTLTGANGFSQTLSGTDATPGTYTFDAVGFLLGGNLDTDHAAFSNVDVTFVPEPAAAGLLALGALGLAGRRRR